MAERKAYLKAKARPTVRDLAWAAGFLDGDGYFGTAGQVSRSPLVGAAQVDPEPLQRLKRWFGGSINLRKARGPNQRPYSEWRVTGGRARGVMFTLYSLLTERRRVAIRQALATDPSKRR